MKPRQKDPKKVAAGRKGGRMSGANFKNNTDLAARAGRRSAWIRHSKKLADYPLEYDESPAQIPKSIKRLERRTKV